MFWIIFLQTAEQNNFRPKADRNLKPLFLIADLYDLLRLSVRATNPIVLSSSSAINQKLLESFRAASYKAVTKSRPRELIKAVGIPLICNCATCDK
jgi:hypothetical protein